MNHAISLQGSAFFRGLLDFQSDSTPGKVWVTGIEPDIEARQIRLYADRSLVMGRRIRRFAPGGTVCTAARATEHIRLSKQAREQLIRLKRHTGIEHWNVLCRWAFCRSLAEESVPPVAKIPADSNVEMSWRVFGGRHHDIYLALLKERCLKDGLGTDDNVVDTQFRLHLHRGIAYLAGDRRIRAGVSALVELAVA